MLITNLQPNEIFVFGSNLAGRHGKGAALLAVQHFGAVYGKGEGLYGNSYALPTKDKRLRTLPLETISKHIATFNEVALANPQLTFLLTAVGTGLAGYRIRDIAPLFKDTLKISNVVIPPQFKRYLLSCPSGTCSILSTKEIEEFYSKCEIVKHSPLAGAKITNYADR